MATLRYSIVMLAALGLLAFLAAPAMAGALDGTGYVAGDATGSAGSHTGYDNNDEEPGLNPNSLTATIVVNGWGTIDKCFGYASATGGVTEYLMTETITNGMPFNITDFHLELGWLIGGLYQSSVDGDGLDFDWGVGGPSNTPTPTSTVLLNMVNTNSEDLLDYYSISAADVVPPGGMFQLTYSVDLPDAPAGVTHLVIRQWATPEPGTFALLATAGLGLGLFAWRRRRERR